MVPRARRSRDNTADSDGTGEWTFIPWDHDLTWGSNWVGTSYSDVIYAEIYELYRTLHDAFGTREWSGNLAHVMKRLMEIRDRQRA